MIVDRLDNPYLPTDTTMPANGDTDASSLADQFREPRCFGRDADGCWRLSGLVCYGKSVLWADLVVTPSGLIEMTSDTHILELPLAINAPLVATLAPRRAT